MTAPAVFFVAVEPSADKLAADLITSLKQAKSGLRLSGIGGAAMKEAGVSSDFDISPLAILGFTEAVKAYPVVRRKVKEATSMIVEMKPDAVVLIDSWGFMIRLAEALGKAGYKGEIIKYVAPQVWAMRPGRAKTLARFTDHLLSIHKIDAPYFEKYDLSVTFVGNPMFDESFDPNETGDFKTRHEISNETVLTVLFGSRPAEIESLYDPFADTIAQIADAFPEVRFFAPLSGNIRDLVIERSKNDPRMKAVILLDESDKYSLFANSDLALACSGTVTTQLAMSGVPAVVAYKLSPVTFMIAKRLYRPDHISLVNISADRPLMTEFVQNDVTPENLGTALSRLIENTDLRAATSKALIDQTKLMKGEGGAASERAAQAILKILKTN